MSWNSKVIGARQKVLTQFLYYLCVSWFFGHVVAFTQYSASYENDVKFCSLTCRDVLRSLCKSKKLWGVFSSIFGHFQAVRKRSKVFFRYSSLFSKVIGVNQKFSEAKLVLFMCVSWFFDHLLDIRPISRSYEEM